MITLKTSLSSALGIITIAVLVNNRLQRMRIVNHGSLWDRLMWSLRINRYPYTFPSDLDDWAHIDAPTTDHWEFMRPFFASKGYILYTQKTISAVTTPISAPACAQTAALLVYPFARRLEGDNIYSMIKSNCVWGARDSLERDVVIKVISLVDAPSNEWLILQKLNSAEVRSNSLNRTIHTIEYLVFDKFVFVVMPRWDTAFMAPFATVSELMELSREYLETLEFLHTLRIAHQDFRHGNAGMNVYGSHRLLTKATGVREPQEVKYIVYDFGHSLLYPLDTDISKVTTSRFLRYFHGPNPEGPYNPFQSDVAMMGGMLYGNVMHAAKFVPEIELFLNNMMEPDETKRPTASQALKSFMELYDGLTPEQLQASVDSKWTNKFRNKQLPALVYVN